MLAPCAINRLATSMCPLHNAAKRGKTLALRSCSDPHPQDTSLLSAGDLDDLHNRVNRRPGISPAWLRRSHTKLSLANDAQLCPPCFPPTMDDAAELQFPIIPTKLPVNLLSENRTRRTSSFRYASTSLRDQPSSRWHKR